MPIPVIIGKLIQAYCEEVTVLRREIIKYVVDLSFRGFQRMTMGVQRSLAT